MSTPTPNARQNGTNDTEQRVLRFTTSVMQVASTLPDTIAGRHLAESMSNAALAAASAQALAQHSWSRQVFIDRLDDALTQFRQIHLLLRIAGDAGFVNDNARLSNLLEDADRLQAIYGKSVSTARRNLAASRSTAA
jgi:four helix bundle protein